MSAETIFAMGSDQMANQFIVLFPLGIPGGGNKDVMSLRMDQAFDPPSEALATYDIFYRGLKITKVSTLEETDKSFSLSFRLDQSWEVYDGLRDWKKMVFDPDTHIALSDSEVRTSVIVQYLGREGGIVHTGLFKGVVIKSLKLESADPSSADPLRVTAEFSYYDFSME